ncbi:MAG TPA: hypothetical protein VHZ29_04150, partial [Rhizomicrobium sp.]|nr:hypothetical protein [Rhizomicrobium sp.]
MPDHRNPLEAWTYLGYTEEEARVLIAWLTSEKRRLLDRAQKKVGSSAEKRNVPRHARNVIQKKAKRLRKSRAHDLPKSILASRYRDVPLLNGM